MVFNRMIIQRKLLLELYYHFYGFLKKFLIFSFLILSILLSPQCILASDLFEKFGATCVAHFDRSIEADYPESLIIEKSGGSIIANGISGGALSLGIRECVSLNITNLINAAEGTLTIWVRPHWDYYSTKKDLNSSHTFVSFNWADGRNGYFALSDGWWEPAGSLYTYFIANNQDYAHVNLKIPFQKMDWVHFACSWKIGNPGWIKLYLNGKLAAVREKFSNFSYSPVGRLFLGSDKGIQSKGGRWADSDFDELAIFSKALSDKEVDFIYKQQDPHWLKREFSWMNSVLSQPYHPITNTEGSIFETRAIFDEGRDWMTKNGASQTISRVKKAGFNVYVPCIWHGKGVRYPSKEAPPEKMPPFIKDDPLANLITLAHEKGVEVHPWFTIALRQIESLRDFYGSGTPTNAFDLHRPEFRKFIINLILDVVKRYEIDGLNLDYIRTMGICKCDYCIAEYRKLTGRDLLRDASQKSPKGELEPHLQNWQNQAVQAIVQEISEKSKRIRPKLILSVDGHPIPQFMPQSPEGRQEVKWANSDLIDIIFSMDYASHPDVRKHELISMELTDPMKLILLLGNYERNFFGQVTPRTPQLLKKLVEYVQRRWPSGTGIYLYSQLSNEQIESLSKGPFRLKAKAARKN